MANNQTPGKNGPWSIVYGDHGLVGIIGPFPTEERANEAAVKGQADGTFDVSDCEVYLLDPNHRMVAFGVDELTEGADSR